MKRLMRQILILAAVVTAVCLCWRLSLKNTYTIRISTHAFVPEGHQDELRPDENGRVELDIRPDGEDILSFGEPRLRDGYVEIEAQPKKHGSAFYGMRAPGMENGTWGNFSVTRFGTIFNASDGGFTGDTIMLFGESVFFIGVCILMLMYFLRAKGKELYSYYTIYTSGFSLFAGLTGLQMLYIFFQHTLHPFDFPMMHAYSVLCSAGASFMALTSPLVVLFSLGLVISNIELLRHERARVQNVLGILAALMLIVGELIGFLLITRDFSGSEWEYRIMETCDNVYCTAFAYFECMLAGAVICALRACLHKVKTETDYIIILGCRFRRDGSLTPLLQGRCDRAIAFWREQKEKYGKEPVLIPSGGQGPDESMSEAEAMARYLRSQGIPDETIRPEDQSRNTFQNMAFSKEVIGDPEAKVVFSTTNYHVFRSGVWAGLAGLKAEGIGSRTKWWFWPNAFLRECVGLLVNRIKQEILFLVVLTAVFGALTMVLTI